MSLQIDIADEAELERARGRAYHLRAFAGELSDMAERLEALAGELRAGELAELAAELREAAAENEAAARTVDEAITDYQDSRAA